MSLLQRSAIEAHLEQIRELPSLPTVVTRMEEAANDRRSDAATFAMIIESDPAVAARLLRLANSAYYRSQEGVPSIQAAVVRIGLEEVRKSCMAIGLIRSFVKPSHFLDHEWFWHHALVVASLARIIAEKHPRLHVDPDTAYTAGLLHDIGTLVLDQYFPECYAEVRNRLVQDEAGLCHVEHDVLEIDHAEVGAILLKQWDLPPIIVEAVRWHHDPERAEWRFRPLAELVHLADFACNRFSYSGPGEQHLWQLSLAAMEDWGMHMEDIQELQTEVERQTDRASTLISLAIT